jgi:hypothetical protein
MSSSSASGGGIGFMGALSIVFIAMKLAGAIDWSWWWVTSPLWGQFAIVFVVAVVSAFVKASQARRSYGRKYGR